MTDEVKTGPRTAYVPDPDEVRVTSIVKVTQESCLSAKFSINPTQEDWRSRLLRSFSCQRGGITNQTTTDKGY